MPRSDGKSVKNISAFDRMIPYIMNRRCDSTNIYVEEFEAGALNEFLAESRFRENKLTQMDFIIAALIHTFVKYPELSRFVVNKKLYKRNHISLSFAMLKRTGGEDYSETVAKIYYEKGDDVFSIAKKVRTVIEENKSAEAKSAMDKLVDGIMGLPLIPSVVVATLKILDKIGLLPKSIINLSPFHSTIFISNIASLNMNYFHHHLYEFGTTSMFIVMGRQIKVKNPDNSVAKFIPLSFSIDERIAAGAAFAKCLHDLKRYIEHPERLQKDFERINGLK